MNGSFGKPHITTDRPQRRENGFSSLIIAAADVNRDSHLEVALTDGAVLLGSATAALHPTPVSTPLSSEPQTQSPWPISTVTGCLTLRWARH